MVEILFPSLNCQHTGLPKILASTKKKSHSRYTRAYQLFTPDAGGERILEASGFWQSLPQGTDHTKRLPYGNVWVQAREPIFNLLPVVVVMVVNLQRPEDFKHEQR